MDKSDIIKIKLFCSVKTTVKRMKRQSADWEKIIANYIFSIVFVPEIYKEFSKLISEETKNSTKKWTIDLNRHFPKENIRIAVRHVKKN